MSYGHFLRIIDIKETENFQKGSLTRSYVNYAFQFCNQLYVEFHLQGLLGLE